MSDVRVEGPTVERGEEILTPEALAFAAARRFDFRPETSDVRDGDWRVPPAPPRPVDRRVEITGPTEPKMAIDALNCGASVWLADLEDANSPHWRNVVGGQLVLKDAVRRTLTHTAPDGREYRLREDGIHGLMEDAATAGISRSQVWHWVHDGVELDTGETVTDELVRRVVAEEVAGIGELDRLDDARRLFEQVSLAEEFPDFRTLPADELID